MESQSIQVSHHPETKGFDLSAGNTWIYPENYPIRQYQYNIVQSALYRNTMVCLPTGLGKTFIAAVVMYNFWRWYPSGKIIFLAPTKPLVAQQIKACYEIMGIPNVDMIELTGAVIQKNREIAWLKKRIIFATPQVFHNDLERSIIPSHLIKCVVMDEAHKALGKHSYCECVRILSTQNQYFRILALSATPGNKLDNVHEVIQNLNISHLELRDENSIDIVPYINKRKVDIILVPLSNELAAFKERYIIIMDRHVKFLMQCNVLRGHTANISKGRVFHLLREFKTKTNKSGNYGQIMKTLNILLTMYHAYELMIRHGLRAFRKFYETLQNLKSTLSRKDSLNNKILNTSNIFSSLYDNNPRMIPNQFTPECHKMHIIALPKTPNEKNKRGKKNINKKKEAFNMKQKENLCKKGNPSQSLMMRFLTDKCNEQNRDKTYNIPTQLTMQNNNTINPNNVKLLTDDNAGIDFLTLYTVKKSEEEMSSEVVSKMDTTYIPAPKPIKDLFSFVVPDVKVINLSFLTEDNLTQCKNYENNLSIQYKNENETIHNNDYTNIDDGNFCTVRNEKSIHNDEIRFEDILDESFDSNETVSCINQRITDIEINSNKVFISDTKEDNEIITDIRTEFSTNTLEDLEPTIFENILNKSFSSIEDDLENKDNTALQKAESNLSNIFAKNTGEINVSYEPNINTFHNEDNIVKPNLLASMKLAKSNKFAHFIDEIQDADFNSDVDISEFINCNSNKNKSICNSKTEESFLSITQAVGEIARVKRNLATSKPSVNKEESINKDSTGWISVNIKNDIKAGKSNPNSRTDNVTLLNTHCNSAAKSTTIKQDFDFLDSDEDFMITEDSAKQFNELESCYFRNSSKNLKDDIRYTPSTSRNSVIRNGCFKDTSKTLKVKNSYFDNILKNLKPCDISTPKNDRHSKLSLKRNKAQQDSNVINLSFFKAPDKYVNSTAEKNILKSNSDTPKRIFPLNEKVAKKSKHRLNGKNNVKNEFIDDEVEVDSDVSSDEIVTDNEDFEDFVSYTQFSQEQVDMHAHYLQTVKSPIKKPGAFHFREPRSPGLNTEIYSQQDLSSQIQNSYLYDSFCVAEDVEPSILHNDLLLDKMERKLEQNRRKRLCFDKNTKYTKKKKMNILNCSVSSEDEIEQLRLQVQED
ncbi:PREDICTED: Fanconi anemia group M protein [Atta cephalotes]|uniref:Helicase ATP-binding domain-containing protein n=1 Tax=Atta cephalotes TaxID=12957 RepID=A0A158P3C0_ATTCE|nr:PREDICTED: Fanconi anemia group M protein [Atta cephalotes]